jgi:phospholipid/cholesterol/gamma-HCH transport system permease protein
MAGASATTAEPEVKPLPLVMQPVAWLGRRVLVKLDDGKNFLLFMREVVRWIFRKPFRVTLLFNQMEFIGNQSLNILIVSGLAVGASFGLFTGSVFMAFRAENLLGGVTAKALCMELAPMVTLILLAGRAGSSMCAEISTMKVNEQVDALEAMAIDPISYLVVPRFLASLLVIPLLTGVFIFVGIIGAFIAGVYLFDIDQGLFAEKITRIVEVRDLERGISKAFAFSGLMAAICCRYGLRASGGAKGVGIATTTAVVVTLLAVLAVDVVITYFQIIW